MPEFARPFSGLSCERKLTQAELVRALRQMIAAEYEAVQMYVQLAEASADKVAEAVLLEVADEERVHAGEFLALLTRLEPEEGKFYAEGADEVKLLVDRLGKR